MKIKQFIEKAIEGGWGIKGVPYLTAETFLRDNNVEAILLDPLAWQAVGKVEGWDGWDENTQKLYRKSGGGGDVSKCLLGYGKKMQNMTQALLAGATIEEYIKTL